MSMHPALAELVQLLDLQPLQKNCFAANNETRGGVRLFGGQVLAQALKAAALTIADGRVAHSIHTYFLRPGSSKRETIYKVKSVRDGGSFSTRSVEALQGNHVIFVAQVSFQTPATGLEHQIDCVQYPSPATMEDDVAIAKKLDSSRTEAMPWLLKERAFEVRSLYSLDVPLPSEPIKPAWLQARGTLADDPLLHQCLFAYSTDMGLMSTSFVPHLAQHARRNFQGVSLDHAIWFHHPFRVDEWLMHDRYSPVTAFCRGLNRASVYDSSGKLVASSMQENLIRLRAD